MSRGEGRASIDLFLNNGYNMNMKVLLDASAIMAVILNEPNRDTVISLTENATLIS